MTSVRAEPESSDKSEARAEDDSSDKSGARAEDDSSDECETKYLRDSLCHLSCLIQPVPLDEHLRHLSHWVLSGEHHS